MSDNSNQVEVKDEQNVNTKPQKTKTEKVLFIIGIVLIVIMVPILILDGILLIKSASNPNEVPSIFGSKPLVIMSASMEEISEEEALRKQVIARGSLNNSDFIWTFDDGIKENALIFVKESDILEYLKNTTDSLDVINEKLVGKTIAFKYPERNQQWSVVVHRIALVEEDSTFEHGYGLRTYGINNPSVDNYSVDPQLVIGEYQGSHINGVGALVKFLTKWYGIVIFAGVPLAAIIIFDVITAKQAAKKEAEQKTVSLEEELARLKAEKEALLDQINDKDKEKKEEPKEE